MLMYPKNSAVASLRCLFFLYVHRYLLYARNCSKISHSKILMCKKMTKNYEVGTLYSKNCTIVKKLTWYKNLIAFLPDWLVIFCDSKSWQPVGEKGAKIQTLWLASAFNDGFNGSHITIVIMVLGTIGAISMQQMT